LEISPVVDAPLLLIEGKTRTLVASDIHLGIEYDLWLGGASIPSQTDKLLLDLKSQVAEIQPDRLLLLGDVKHNVPRTSWQEKTEVPKFLKSLADLARVEIVMGNHDPGLANLAPEGTSIRPPTGFVLDGVGYFHGHRWPDRKLLSCELLVCGHLHPGMRLMDPLGHATSERAWARGFLSQDALEEQYFPGELPKAFPEMVVVPAFNWLCGILPLNALDNEPKDRGPLLRMIDFKRTRGYLLDGTDLGCLDKICPGKGKRSRKGYISRRSKGQKPALKQL
jgi:hypothetical protein